MRPPSNSIRDAVRTELGLGDRRPRRQPLRLLRLAAATAILWCLATGRAEAQAPYRQEVLLGFSSLDVGDYCSPALVDLDDDGDLDAVVGWHRGTLRYLANIGTPTAPAFAEVGGDNNPFAGISTTFYSSPALADLDGDGDLDLVLGQISGTLAYFTNTGTSTTPAFVEASGTASPFSGIDVGYNSSPELVDLDGDGDLDAVVGDAAGTLRTFSNTGSPSAPAFLERTGTANPVGGISAGFRSSPELVDLDADGDFDAIIGAGPGELNYLENTGSSSAPAFSAASGSANPFDGTFILFGTPDLVDLDADGDLDAIFGTGYAHLRYFENVGSSSVPTFVDASGTDDPFVGIDVGLYGSPDMADLDGDGDNDAIVGNGMGTLRTFANTGSSSAPAFVQATGTNDPFLAFDVGDNSRPELADLDGDGDLDAVVGNGSGTLRTFTNSGSSSAPAFVEVSGTANPFFGVDVGYDSSPELADLDGDADADATVGERSGKLRYFKNTGSSSAPAFVEAGGTTNPLLSIDVGYNSTPALIDLDRDGDIDAVVGERSGTLRYIANTGSSVAPSFVELTGIANPFAGILVGGLFGWSKPSLEDLDVDGDLDMLVGEGAGRLVFFRSLAAIFSDGFESGDTSRWSLTVSLVNLQPARAPGGAPPDR